jgi:glycine betaine/choline ABC-type transport system substrate-binding protein
MFDALRAGAITAAWTSTADVAVPDGVVVLVDRKPTLVPAQNVVALYRRNELNQMQLRAINELAGVLDTAALVDMLRQVRAGADPRSVAEAWLTANPLGR